LPSLQVTQNRQRGWKKNANKSSVIDITPPKDYIISTENLLVVGRLEIPFEIVCFQVT